METSKMKYPFGRCINCGKEFNSELRNEYGVTHCPWCGVEIDDFLKPDNQTEHHDDIYCEECGQRIFGRFGKNHQGGNWIEGGMETGPGVCSGPCERELCGQCGDWDEEGCCPKCHEEPCVQCGTITSQVVNEEYCCPDCKNELLAQGAEMNHA